MRGGYGYGWGCPNGITSSMIKSAGVYAVDHDTTMHYAAAVRAARESHQRGGRGLPGEYLRPAARATHRRKKRSQQQYNRSPQ